MQVLLCEGFVVEPNGFIACEGQAATLTLEEIREQPVSQGVTLEQLDLLIAAAIVALVIAYIFQIVLRQLR